MKTTAWEDGRSYQRQLDERYFMKHKNAKSIWNEGEDGWWAILKDGLVIDGCSGVHEETLPQLLSRLDDARQGQIY